MASKKVRVAIIGVGNCASSLVQGVQFYKEAADDEHVPGIMHARLGGYHIRDIEFTLGIDVNIIKVGKDLLLGDDIKSQVGATILHRALATLFVDRGVRIDRTYQLNFGGNTDFLNMLERECLESKKISKTNAVTSMIPYELEGGNVHVGPSDPVPWLADRKWAYIRMEGTTFGDVPLNVELKLEVWDSPNSAGVMIDAIRSAKIALDRKLSSPIVGPSSYFFKTPPKQFRDEICREKVEAFIMGDSNE